MGDNVIRLVWFCDDEGNTYLGRYTEGLSKVDRAEVTGKAKKALGDFDRRLDRVTRRQA